MAITSKSDVIIPELWDKAVQGAFAQKNAFLGSALVATGAAVVSGDMPKGEPDVGDEIKVPYFGVIGEFGDITDGNPLVPKKMGQMKETATVAHAGLALEVTRWARSSAGADIYQEGARQMLESARRFMDQKLIETAYGTPYKRDIYSSSVPKTLDYKTVVDSKIIWGDEQDEAVALAVDSKTYGDLLNLTDGLGHPLVTHEASMGAFPRFCGLALVVSDHLRPETAEAMGSVTEAGTSPPNLTLAGTPLAPFNLRVVCTLAGARGTFKFKFSTDGGFTYSDEITTVDANDPIDLIDPAVDSVVGVNGKTGLTFVWEDASASIDNVWTASYAKHNSLILRRGALAFWYNTGALSLQTDKDILVDSDIAASHLYYAAHRYKRARGGTKCGVIRIVHN